MIPLPPEAVRTVFAGRTRWQLMQALSRHPELTIDELAREANCSKPVARKQMRAMLELEIVERRRRVLYTLNRKRIRNPSPGVLDFGKVQVYFDRADFEPLPEGNKAEA